MSNSEDNSRNQTLADALKDALDENSNVTDANINNPAGAVGLGDPSDDTDSNDGVEVPTVADSNDGDQALDTGTLDIPNDLIDGQPSASKTLSDALSVLTNGLASDDASGVAHGRLFHTIIRLLTTEENTSACIKGCLSGVQEIMRAASDEFSPRKAFRGLNKIKGVSPTQITEYEVLLQILIDTAVLETRVGNVKSMNWRQITDAFNANYSETLVRRLQDYLNV